MFPHKDNSFFAIQVKTRGDDESAVAAAFLRAASQLGIGFQRLDVLDTLTIGATTFVRFQADLINPWPILERLHEEGRSIVGPGKADTPRAHGYLVRLANGRTGSAPFAAMQSAPRALKTYRGTSNPHWARQFSSS